MAVGSATGSKRPEDVLAALESASKQTVTDENGQNIEFGSLFKSNKAIVIFVRVSQGDPRGPPLKIKRTRCIYKILKSLDFTEI